MTPCTVDHGDLLPPGCTYFDREQDDEAWSRFRAAFGALRPGLHADAWPAITEPAPSPIADSGLFRNSSLADRRWGTRRPMVCAGAPWGRSAAPRWCCPAGNPRSSADTPPCPEARSSSCPSNANCPSLPNCASSCPSRSRICIYAAAD
ncbi:DUF2716 domain-containing protein [Rhodococcus corynebacterioides]|nr:DUF2716 domain-containing protein [Rhodococcus corynebacterioides]